MLRLPLAVRHSLASRSSRRILQELENIVPIFSEGRQLQAWKKTPGQQICFRVDRIRRNFRREITMKSVTSRTINFAPIVAIAIRNTPNE
jgi:hypothetical protein